MNLQMLKSQLTIHEGMRLKPYTDTVGKLTIGVGRNLDDVGISEDEAMVLLDNDILSVFTELDRALPWWRDMNDYQQMALTDMCFNLGITRLLGFKNALAAMQARDFDKAADEMLASKWSRQVGKRADTLAEMMRG